MKVKKFVVASWETTMHSLSGVQVMRDIVGVYECLEEAKKVLDKCIEGDDKHDPLDYSIIEKNVTVS